MKKEDYQIQDVRNRTWSKLNSPAAELSNSLIKAEDIFSLLDDYQMNNDQCYPEIEDMMLLCSDLRAQYQNFIDTHLEILDIKDND